MEFFQHRKAPAKRPAPVIATILALSPILSGCGDTHRQQATKTPTEKPSSSLTTSNYHTLPRWTIRIMHRRRNTPRQSSSISGSQYFRRAVAYHHPQCRPHGPCRRWLLHQYLFRQVRADTNTPGKGTTVCIMYPSPECTGPIG